MIFGGYFEEWGIRYSGYNIADLQKNGVADQLTHLIYAFGNVTATATPACAIADPSAAYQDSTLPSVSGKAYTAPLYGNFGTTATQDTPSLTRTIAAGLKQEQNVYRGVSG
jgi:GH18 family chitinase